MMYWHKHSDGSMTRKLVEDWTDEEKALDLRHKEFLKEAEALGYVIRLNTGTSKWEVRNKMKDDDDTQVYRSELEAAVRAEREAILKLVRVYVSNKHLEEAIQARERNPMPLFDDWGAFPYRKEEK